MTVVINLLLSDKKLLKQATLVSKVTRAGLLAELIREKDGVDSNNAFIEERPLIILFISIL